MAFSEDKNTQALSPHRLLRSLRFYTVSKNFHPEWQHAYALFLNKTENINTMRALEAFLVKQRKLGKSILPANVFYGFQLTGISEIKVVILGQDPYPGRNAQGTPYAEGLAFSAPMVKNDLPASLRNILQEVQANLKLLPGKNSNEEEKGYAHGDEKLTNNAQTSLSNNNAAPSAGLACWAKQGVFLLNSALTVEEGRPASHRGQGWEKITDYAVQCIAEQNPHVVFMLWGAHAREKLPLIEASCHSLQNQQKNEHLVLTSSHPSPLSAHRGFLGCQHFAKANAFLEKKGCRPIDWGCVFKKTFKNNPK